MGTKVPAGASERGAGDHPDLPIYRCIGWQPTIGLPTAVGWFYTAVLVGSFL